LHFKDFFLYDALQNGIEMLKSTIGILGGMGPKSTGPFIDQVISQFQAITGAKDDIDFPPIMIYSLPTPFYLDRPIDHKLMEKTICEGLKKLESCGVSFIAMPCNTAHLYFETLKNCIQVPLLNMISIALNAIQLPTKKIVILGTRPTIESHIFQKELTKKGLKYIQHPQWQKKIDELILRIKKENNPESLISIWESLATDLLYEQVDTVLLACSDLNIIFKHLTLPFKLVDSSLCLAKAIVNKWIELKP
jgi:amino-acid racemase